jgi:putative restriction endonuclease
MICSSSMERHERPHKPILLLVILDLLALNKASPERIPWTNDLRSRFTAYFERVRSSNDSNTPENPFLYLRGDGFWQPFLGCDETTIPLDRTPTVGDAATNQVFARLTNGLENFVCLQTQRVRLREALASRYFPTKRGDIEPLFVERVSANAEKESERGKAVDAWGKSGGRNPAFRRKILEIYDSQCVACGLRIKLPDNWFTFIDGAHLVPFMFSRNDHPTNGIALCKNHHWAMDE